MPEFDFIDYFTRGGRKLRTITSGVVFVGVGMGLWIALLFADCARYFIVVSRAGKHHHVAPGVVSAIVERMYPLMFVLAAWIVARRKWSANTLWAFPVAYVLLVGGFVLICNYGRGLPEHWLEELIMLLAPIPLSMLTAALARLKESKRNHGANEALHGIAGSRPDGP